MQPTLADILARTRAELKERRPHLGRLEAAALARPAPRSLTGALGGSTVGLIAEVKRRSPSRGAIAEDLDPVALARACVEGGASGISVLTDGPFFGGSLGDLEAVTAAVQAPVLRKDFILEEAQVLEARAAGASAILLLVRAHDARRLRALHRFAGDLGLDALVEAHGERELDRALELPAPLLGVNSRDLDTFEVNVSAAALLLARIPAHIVAVAESGLESRADVHRVSEAGADAVLIGTALSASAEPAALAGELSSVPRRGR
jgi:indole-3-glycerol phosphate synthase